MKVQGKYVVVLAFLLSSTYLAYDSLTTYVNPYISVDEIAGRPEKYSGKNVQVIGVPDMDSVVNQGGGVVSFEIMDGNERLSVVFTGTMPQNFEQSEEVVVIGTVNEEGALESEQILANCPSKYESQEEPKQTNTFFVAALLVAVAAVGYIVMTVFWKKG